MILKTIFGLAIIGLVICYFVLWGMFASYVTISVINKDEYYIDWRLIWQGAFFALWVHGVIFALGAGAYFIGNTILS